MGKFAKTSAPISMKFVDLDAGRLAQAKSHNLNVDMRRMTEIKGMRFHIELIFSLKLNGFYVPLTFLLTWKFALNAFARAGGELKNKAKRAETTEERFSKVRCSRWQR